MAEEGQIILESVRIDQNPIRPITHPILQNLITQRILPHHQHTWFILNRIIHINQTNSIHSLLQAIYKTHAPPQRLFNQLILLYAAALFLIPWLKLNKRQYISKRNHKALEYNVYRMSQNSKAFLELMVEYSQFLSEEESYPIWRGIWQAQLKKYNLTFVQNYSDHRFALSYNQQLYYQGIKMPSCVQFLCENNEWQLQLKYGYELSTKGISFRDFTPLLPLLKSMGNRQYEMDTFVSKFVPAIENKIKVANQHLQFYFTLSPDNIFIIYQQHKYKQDEELHLDIFISIEPQKEINNTTLNNHQSIYIHRMPSQYENADFWSAGVILLELLYQPLNPHFSKLMRHSIEGSSQQDFLQDVYDVMQRESEFGSEQIKEKVKCWLKLKDCGQKQQVRWQSIEQKGGEAIVKSVSNDFKKKFRETPVYQIDNPQTKAHQKDKLQTPINTRQYNTVQHINNKVNTIPHIKQDSPTSPIKSHTKHQGPQGPTFINQIQFTAEDLPFQQKRIVKIEVDPEQIGTYQISKEKQVLLLQNLKNYEMQDGQDVIFARHLSSRQAQKEINLNMESVQLKSFLSSKKDALNEFVVVYERCSKCLQESLVYYASCSHKLCFKCLESHIVSCFQDMLAGTIQPIKCLYCSQLLCEQLLTQFCGMSARVRLEYRKILLKLMAHRPGEKERCHIAYCRQFSCVPPLLYYVIDGSTTKALKCYYCCGCQCVKCGDRLHLGMSCFQWVNKRSVVAQWIERKMQQVLGVKRDIAQSVLLQIGVNYQDILIIQNILNNILSLIWCSNKLVEYNSTQYTPILDIFCLLQMWIADLASFYAHFHHNQIIQKKNQSALLNTYDNLRVIKYKYSQLYFMLYDSTMALKAIQLQREVKRKKILMV